MRRLLSFLVLVVLTSSFAFAQMSKVEIDLYQDVFGSEKKAVVAECLKLEKSDAFWLIYEQYETERKILGQKRIKLLDSYAENFEALNDDETNKIIKDAIIQKKNLDKLIGHLADKHQFTNYEVPEALAQNRSVGCRMVEWNNTEVALICFSVDGELVHLMVLPKTQLPEIPKMIKSVQAGEWATAGWKDEDNVYLVATKGGAEFLQEVMEGQH